MMHPSRAAARSRILIHAHRRPAAVSCQIPVTLYPLSTSQREPPRPVKVARARATPRTEERLPRYPHRAVAFEERGRRPQVGRAQIAVGWRVVVGRRRN